MQQAPSVSVVVPTFNRVGRLRSLLAALADQTWPVEDMEIVVVSDGSTDGTDDYLTSDAVPCPIRPVLQTNAGPAVARNRGAEEARGATIVFLDDDVVPDVRLVEEHMSSHDGDGRSVVVGPMLTPDGYQMSPWVRWEQAMLEKQYEELRLGVYEARSRQFYTGNASLARRQLLDVGGFDPRYLRAEDIELAYRLEAAGARFEFNPNAVTHHYAERSFASWIQIPRAYGMAKVHFAEAGARQWVLDDAANEFHDLNVINRVTSRALVDRPRMSAALATTISKLAPLTDRFGLHRVTRYALSGLYNVEYCQGLADGLGGRDAFEALIRSGQRRERVTPVG